jgi:1-acyl-sn-glycerol-3-phosphate acyltransferase
MRIITGILSLIWKIYIGVVFTVFAIALYPFFLVLLSRPQWKKKSFKLFVFWSWMMRILCFYHVKKIENHPLPKGPYVIIANHSSYLDIFFMHSILPDHPFLFLGKAELLSYPIIATYFKGLNIPVYRKDRSKAGRSFIKAREAVSHGWSIVIFPEGGIPDEDNPRMVPFKAGAFKLAKQLELPIVPLTFTNNYHLFSDPTNILGPAHPGFSRLYVHPHISKSEVIRMSDKELSDHCFSIVNGPLLKEYPHLRN